ncbi:BCL2/adenovirus E1B 19 kDa protein-interacting protein 2 isoform X3 [Larus michahellis]
MEGVEFKEEWQDEDFPRPLPEDDPVESDILAAAGTECEAEVNGTKVRKKLMAPDISLTLDHSGESVLSDDLDESGEIDLDNLDTPSENSNEFEWEDDLPKPKTTDVIRKGSLTEYTAAEDKDDGRRWRMFRIGEQDHRVDMKAIEPYKKVISHGGYYGDGLNAIVVFAVCFMPESSQPNYRYLMDNLFKYVIGTLELLVAENYMIVYLNGATTRRKMPSLGWLRKCYQQIDRRLRKNLKSLIIVHPSWFIRTLLAITKPFISSKFSQKIRYVFTLAELAELIPMEYVGIPECIKQYEEEKFRKKQKRVDQELNGKQEQKSEQNTWTLRESVVVVRTADMRSDFGSRSPGSAGSPMAVKFSDYFEAPAAREGTGLCPRGGAGLGPVATLALPLPGREGPEGPASSGGRERCGDLADVQRGG